MRDLSDFEKRCIKLMIDDNPEDTCRTVLYTLVSIICDSKTKAKFVFDDENKKLWIDPIIDDNNIPNIIANKLVELMLLIKYLESQYLVQLYHTGAEQKLKNNPKDKVLSFAAKEVNLTVYEFYSKHWDDYLYVSVQLRHIVIDNNFKSDNQIYVERQLAEAKKQTILAQKQTRNSWIAIIISIIALVASIVLPFC